MMFESLVLICPRAAVGAACDTVPIREQTTPAKKAMLPALYMPAKLTRVRLRRHAVRIHRPFPYFTDSTCVRQELF